MGPWVKRGRARRAIYRRANVPARRHTHTIIKSSCEIYSLSLVSICYEWPTLALRDRTKYSRADQKLAENPPACDYARRTHTLFKRSTPARRLRPLKIAGRYSAACAPLLCACRATRKSLAQNEITFAKTRGYLGANEVSTTKIYGVKSCVKKF